MMAMAVKPIARPIGIRASTGGAAASDHGDAGCCSTVAKNAADTMNTARHTNSLRYSGQWDRIIDITATRWMPMGPSHFDQLQKPRRRDDIEGAWQRANGF